MSKVFYTIKPPGSTGALVNMTEDAFQAAAKAGLIFTVESDMTVTVSTSAEKGYIPADPNTPVCTCGTVAPPPRPPATPGTKVRYHNMNRVLIENAYDLDHVWVLTNNVASSTNLKWWEPMPSDWEVSR